jgi:hypothetical protein
MLENKAYIDVPKTIVITIISAFIFICFIIILAQSADITIDEKKINTQLVLNKMFNGKCFSDEFATIEASKLTQENLDKCFQNLNEKILFKIQVSGTGNHLYSGNKENDFELKRNYCHRHSNVLCTRMIYPITFIDENNAYSTQKIVIDIISF